ncbi:hypothetical protein VKT23_016932 [Stygiomarasmius scandens]|uniref:F-box domain-containing protein n=1 Tax=Marasmiellus scandens TaxID=2682957 RepID=A0ABR1IXP4_9AGAR
MLLNPPIILCDKCQAEITTTKLPTPPHTLEQFRSMHLPFDNEITHMNKLVKTTRQDVDLYNAEIDKVRDTLTKLENRRDGIQQYIDQNLAFVSSIRRFPVEVLTEIFTLCTTTTTTASLAIENTTDNRNIHPNRYEISTPSLTLSQTCSLWRHILHTNPKLWACLSLNLSHDRAGDKELIEMYLHRSQGALLTLELYNFQRKFGVVYQDGAFSDYARSIVRALVGVRGRWGRVFVDFHWGVYSDFDDFLDDGDLEGEGQEGEGEEPPCHFANLQYLKLGRYGANREPNPFFSLINSNAPKLQSLHIPIFHREFHLPFKQLQKLTIGRCYITEIADALSLCEGLQELDVEAHHLTEHYMLLPIHQNLRSLTLTFWQCDDMRILSTFSLPSLTTLALSLVDYTPDEERILNSVTDQFEEMVTRSRCELGEVRLRGYLFASDDDLIRFLGLVPTLTRLTLDVITLYDGYLTETFFRALTLDSSARLSSSPMRNVLLPRLTCLRIATSQYEAMSTSVTVENVDICRLVQPPALPDVQLFLSLVESRRCCYASWSSDFRMLCCLELSFKIVPGKEGSEWARSFESTIKLGLRAFERDGMRLLLEFKGPERGCFREIRVAY